MHQEYFELILKELDKLQRLAKIREKPFLSIDEASEYLGISKATIYGYTSKNIIPFHKLQDRRLYFNINDLNNFVLSSKNRYQSNAEIESKAAIESIKMGRG